MQRNNPFKEVYDLCDSGAPEYKYDNLPEFPRYIDIELTNYCNYNCLMCPVGTGIMKREQGFMAEKTFKKILDEIKIYKTPIRFIRWGEPTLHREFIDFIKQVKKLGIICHFNTNGTLLNEESMKELVEIGLDSIKFSFQGVDDKSYSEMRNSNCFKDLIDKIKLLHILRGEKQYPFIHVASTITYESKNQVDTFKKVVQDHCDLVTIGRTILEHINVDEVKLNQDEKNTLKMLKEEETVVKKHLNCCPEVFDKLSVNWNGDVTACCGDYDNKMLIGNINYNSLLEIWNSSQMMNYRKILKDKHYDMLELCKSCYDYMELESK